MTRRRTRTIPAAVLVLGLVSSTALAQVLVGSLTLESEWSGAGEDGRLDHPMGIVVTAGGNVLVADGAARIAVYDSDGVLLDRWSLPDGSRPVGMAERPDGSILVADYTGDRVLLLDAGGKLLAIWGQSGDGAGEFQAPSGVTVTPSGHAVVVEFIGQRVQELDARGSFVRFIDGGEPGRAHAHARGPMPGMESMQMSMVRAGDPHGLYAFPTDAAVAPDGTLYVSNTHAYEILVFEADGTLRTAWGRKGSGAGDWEVPVGVTVDQQGNLWVADSANFRVQGLDPTGTAFLVSRAAERWYRTTRRVYSPTDVAVDARGRLFVVDFAASQVQRFAVLR